MESSLDLPPGFESREWGFILFDDTGMRRHKSYFSQGELADYVRAWFQPTFIIRQHTTSAPVLPP